MIKTNDDVATTVFRLVKSLFQSEVGGKIYNGKNRPVDANTEDIVVKTLANQIGQKQEAFVNVNFYIPDIYVGKQYLKNDTRVAEIERLAIDRLAVNHTEDARLTIDGFSTLASQNGKEHVVSVKILLQTINE